MIVINFTTIYFYFYLLISGSLKKYIYGFFLKKTQCWVFFRDLNLVLAFKFLKKNHMINFSLLLDVFLTDLLQFSTLKRYVLTYVFLTYLKQIRFLVKSFLEGVNGFFSLNSIYFSGN